MTSPEAQALVAALQEALTSSVLLERQCNLAVRPATESGDGTPALQRHLTAVGIHDSLVTLIHRARLLADEGA